MKWIKLTLLLLIIFQSNYSQEIMNLTGKIKGLSAGTDIMLIMDVIPDTLVTACGEDGSFEFLVKLKESSRGKLSVDPQKKNYLLFLQAGKIYYEIDHDYDSSSLNQKTNFESPGAISKYENDKEYLKIMKYCEEFLLFWDQLTLANQHKEQRPEIFNEFFKKICGELVKDPSSPSSIIILADMVNILIIESKDSIFKDTFNKLDPVLQKSFYGKKALGIINWWETARK